MNLNDVQRKEFLESAKPLMKWLSENCHPHCKCILDSTNVELVEGIARVVTEEFIKD